MEMIRVWIQREQTDFIDVVLPMDEDDLSEIIDEFLVPKISDDDPVYISDYEYLFDISYEAAEYIGFVDQFTNVFDLNRQLQNLDNCNNTETALALLEADMIGIPELCNLETLNGFLDSCTCVKLDENIKRYKEGIDEQYYWIILEEYMPSLSDILYSENIESYFDVKGYVEDMVLCDTTVTSNGYLVYNY